MHSQAPKPYEQPTQRWYLPSQASSRRDLLRIAPLAVLIYTFLLLPPEVSATVLSVNLPSYRVVLIALSLYLLVGLMKGAHRPTIADLMVAGALGWMLLSFMLIYGAATGLVRGFGLLIDAGGAYFLARMSVTSFQDLRRLLIIIAPGLAFAAGLLLVESLSGRLIYRPLFASVFGTAAAYSGGEADGSVWLREEFRLGLLRAYGPFSHPILGGVTMAAFLPLYFFSKLRSWPLFVGLASSATAIFSLSSAAFLALMIGGGAIAIDFAKRRFFPISWPIILSFFGLVLAGIQIGSQSGVIAVMSRFTLNPGTASYRTLIWEYGGQSIAKHPWIGIGYQPFERLSWMGESVDAHFLLLGIRHGIIVPLLLIAALVWTAVSLAKASRSLSLLDRDLALGLNIALVMLFVVGQTVAFFGSTNLLFMGLIGIAVAMADHARTKVAASPRYPLPPHIDLPPRALRSR